MEATINPYYVTTSTEEGDANEQKIARRVQNAVENNGQCIYNVSDGETYGLPRILPLKECINEIPEGERFTGWVGYSTIRMVDLALASKKGEDAIRASLETLGNSFSVETRDMLADNPDFEPASADCTTVAIRVDNPDGTWFEYIIGESV